jgi:hypothetical protein
MKRKYQVCYYKSGACSMYCVLQSHYNLVNGDNVTISKKSGLIRRCRNKEEIHNKIGAVVC